MKVFLCYIKELYGFSKRKFIGILLFMVADGLTSGIGLLMLVPLLAVTGIVGESGLDVPVLNGVAGRISGYTVSVQLILILTIYLALIVMQGMISRRLAILNVEIIQGYTKHLRVSLYKKLVKSEWSCFAEKKKSNITNAFTNEIVRIGAGTVYFLKILSQIIVAIFQLAVACMMSVPLTLFVVFCGLLVLWFMNSTFGQSKKLGGALKQVNQELVSQIMEQLDGVKEAKSYGIEDIQIDSFEKTAEKTRRNLTDFTKMQSKTNLLYTISAAIVICLLFYFSVIALKMEPAALLVIVYIFARLWPSFRTLQSNIQNVIAMLPSYEALKELSENLDTHYEKIHHEKSMMKFSADASIRFENIYFRYHGLNEFELKNLNFEIPAKKITAFVGKSGAGKSTIVDLLIGLLKPTTGRITVDGETIDESTLMKWRRSIAYVPQNPFLFNSTIRENLIRYTPEATDKEIQEALAFSEALEFVKKLPQGIDTVIGDSGVRLSGGERQRLVLARALLRKPQYLVLDEATSSLDNENEYRIQRAIESLAGRLTVVVIAHRLSTIRNADNIIVVDDGRVADQGTYKELLEKKGSYLSNALEIYQ